MSTISTSNSQALEVSGSLSKSVFPPFGHEVTTSVANPQLCPLDGSRKPSRLALASKRPLHLDTEVRPFNEVPTSTSPKDPKNTEDAKDATLKIKILQVYYPVSQVRNRVGKLWKHIEGLWERMLPEALDSLLPGLTEQDIEELERLGCQFPEDLAESLRVHEGMTESIGHRKGQFLLELDREDVYAFSTVCFRAARDLPDLVEDAKTSAGKIPQVPRSVTDFQRFARPGGVSLTAMASVAESPSATATGATFCKRLS